jgi:hypothetical protein
VARWSALSEALEHGDGSVTFSWSELDQLVGGLPASAEKHRAWWSGDRPHVRAWRAAGYTLADLASGRSVTFVRATQPAVGAQPAGSSKPRMPDSATLARADIVLVACARTKLNVPAPARDLYVSPLFRKSRSYAERLGVPWFILSAEHGLLPPDQLVAPYERYLPNTPDSYRTAWGLWTVERLALLTGALDGRVIEVHAGAAYVDAIAPRLAAKGAQVIDRLKGLTLGARLAWYDAQIDGDPTAAVEKPEADVRQLAEQLRTVEAAMSPAQFLATNGAGLKVPGLYSWWVDHAGAHDLTAGLKHPVTDGLIYAGLAGATRWPSGGRSTNTLWSRIATMHLGGNHEFSTFRRTVGAILAAAAGRDRIDENQLTTWMHQHLKIVAVPYDDADRLGRLEERVLEEIDPSFNLKGMPRTPVRSSITQLRRTYNRAG